MGKLITTNAEVVEALRDLPGQIERYTAEVQAGFGQFQNGLSLRGARYLEADRRLVWGGPGRLLGWSFRVQTNPVTVALRDGRGGQGAAVAVFGGAAGSLLNPTWLPPGGVSFTDALFADFITGAPSDLLGSYYIGATD